jgi:integrase
MSEQATGQVLELDRKGGRAFALRFRAYGKRRYLTLGTAAEGWNRRRAEDELANVLADVRRGIWAPYEPPAAPEPAPEPTFHEFASEWLDGLRHEGLSGATLQDYTWQLCNHMLPFFAKHRLSEITIAEVDRYRQEKVREETISAASITRLAQILEVAVERELIDRNPARGKRRRLKERRPERTWLDRVEQIAALLEAGGELDAEARIDRRATPRRVFLATLTLAGLRIGEALALRWTDVDLPAGRLRVADSKTDAGVRMVDLLPALREELSVHKAQTRFGQPDDFVFPTESGRRQDRNRNNARRRVVVKSVERANENLTAAGRNPLPEGITPHSLRRTFISLLLATGAEVPYVMRQVGHSDPKVTLSIYAQVMYRGEGERERLKTVVEGSDWALLGTGGDFQPGEQGEQLILEAAEPRLDAENSTDGPARKSLEPGYPCSARTLGSPVGFGGSPAQADAAKVPTQTPRHRPASDHRCLGRAAGRDAGPGHRGSRCRAPRRASIQDLHQVLPLGAGPGRRLFRADGTGPLSLALGRLDVPAAVAADARRRLDRLRAMRAALCGFAGRRATRQRRLAVLVEPDAAEGDHQHRSHRNQRVDRIGALGCLAFPGADQQDEHRHDQEHRADPDAEQRHEVARRCLDRVGAALLARPCDPSERRADRYAERNQDQ